MMKGPILLDTFDPSAGAKQVKIPGGEGCCWLEIRPAAPVGSTGGGFVADTDAGAEIGYSYDRGAMAGGGALRYERGPIVWIPVPEGVAEVVLVRAAYTPTSAIWLWPDSPMVRAVAAAQGAGAIGGQLSRATVDAASIITKLTTISGSVGIEGGARSAELATIADLTSWSAAAWTTVPGSEVSVPSWVKAIQYVGILTGMSGTWANFGFGVDMSPDSTNYLSNAAPPTPFYYGSTLVAPANNALAYAAINPEVPSFATALNGPACNLAMRPTGKVRAKYYMGTVPGGGALSLKLKLIGWG